MIRNYLKIAVRNLLKNKSISVINGMGLALGMAVCLLMYLYVTHEFEYDSHHAKSDRIVRVTSRLRGPESDLAVATSPLALANMLRRDIPEIETAVRMQQTTAIFRLNRQPVSEEGVFFTDANVFDVFTFSFLEGDGGAALQKPHSAVLTETFARRYFKGPAVGKIVYCNKEAYQVTGVIKDPPTNSDLKIRVLLSKNYAGAREWLDDFPAYTFALFHKKPEIDGFEAKLHRLTRQYVQPELKKAGATDWFLTFHPEMLKDVHYSEGKEGDTPKGKRQYNYLFSVLSVFVMLIALLNYVNLSTVKATERSREVGIRKVVGARRSQLIRQFLFDALLLNIVAVTVAVLIVIISIPYFNSMLGIVLTLNMGHGVFIGVVFLVSSMLAGFYPAIVLSGYQPVKVLKGRFRGSFQGLWLRKSVTLFQFVIAAAMLICTIVVYRQMQFLQKRDLGFEQEQVVNLYLPDPDDTLSRRNITPFVNEVRQQSGIKSASVGSGIYDPNTILAAASTWIAGNGKKRELMNNYLFIDEHFVPLLQLKLKEGRNLSADFGTDVQEGFLVNEAFVKQAGWKKAVGQDIEGFGHKGKVVGVVKNFHYKSLHSPIEPIVMIWNTFPASTLVVKLKPGSLAVLNKLWPKYFPETPLSFSFMDTAFGTLYKADQVRMTLFNYFTLMAVFISMLGLYGLVSMVSIQRTKEIGIRKTIGASVGNIVALLSKDFVKLAVVAFAIAIPFAWYFMDRWLWDFAYRVEMEWWMFVLGGCLSLFIALATISYESVKAALLDPVKSLRSE